MKGYEIVKLLGQSKRGSDLPRTKISIRHVIVSVGDAYFVCLFLDAIERETKRLVTCVEIALRIALQTLTGMCRLSC